MNRFFNPFFIHNLPKPTYLPPHKFKENSSNKFETPNICTEKNFHEIDPKEKPLFEILGIKLFSDDLLILALIYFLYKENINDTLLFIALFSLLF